MSNTPNIKPRSPRIEDGLRLRDGITSARYAIKMRQIWRDANFLGKRDVVTNWPKRIEFIRRLHAISRD